MDVQYWIMIITFLISIGGLVWKMSRLANTVETNTKDIQKINSRIDKITSERNSEINEIRQQILTIIQSQARIEERIVFLIDEIKTIKSK